MRLSMNQRKAIDFEEGANGIKREKNQINLINLIKSNKSEFQIKWEKLQKMREKFPMKNET